MGEHKPELPADCGHCKYFRNDPTYLERLFPGLTSLSSGYGSVRANDGICLRHDRYLSARASCGAFAPAPPEIRKASPGP